jgi:hypothetical protein
MSGVELSEVVSLALCPNGTSACIGIAVVVSSAKAGRQAIRQTASGRIEQFKNRSTRLMDLKVHMRIE